MIGFSGLSTFKPSALQLRFMLHCYGNKPHLDLIKGRWRCVGRHLYGFGSTWRVALADWQAQMNALDWNDRRRG